MRRKRTCAHELNELRVLQRNQKRIAIGQPSSKEMVMSLYLPMFGMPLIGWLILSAEGEPVPFFELTLPPLTGPNEALAERMEELYELGGTIGYFLIGLHTLAALVHHYLLRDLVLARMLPTRP